MTKPTEAEQAKIGGARAVLLANHGPVVSGDGLLEAQYASKELGETAKLYLMVRGTGYNVLTEEQSAKLRKP